MTSSDKYTDYVSDKLTQASDRFHRNGSHLDDETIREFLAGTDGLGLSEGDRLTALLFGGDLSWHQTSQLCEIIITVSKELGEQAGTYITWLAIAMNYWLLESSGLTFEQRIDVANDVERILDRCLKLIPEHSGFAKIYADYYLLHPQRSIDNETYLRKALTWFRQASLWAQRSTGTLEDAAESQIGAGNCLFELEDWAASLSEYEKLDLQWLADSGFEPLPELRNKMDECRRRLST